MSPGMLSLLSQKKEMVRSESLRVDPGDRAHRIFRPSDLIHGEVLGKGCFGQAVKVPCCFHHFVAWLQLAFSCNADFNQQHCYELISLSKGNASGDWGGHGDERVDTLRRRDAEDFFKGGKWSWAQKRPEESMTCLTSIPLNLYR